MTYTYTFDLNHAIRSEGVTLLFSGIDIVTHSSLPVWRHIATSERFGQPVQIAVIEEGQHWWRRTKFRPNIAFCSLTKCRCVQFVVVFCLCAWSVLVFLACCCVFLLNFVAGKCRDRHLENGKRGLREMFAFSLLNVSPIALLIGRFMRW